MIFDFRCVCGAFFEAERLCLHLVWTLLISWSFPCCGYILSGEDEEKFVVFYKKFILDIDFSANERYNKEVAGSEKVPNDAGD